MKKIKSNTVKVGMLTLGSRCLGLGRDSLIASYLGSSWVSDVYITAFRIPNMLRDLLGEGALSSVIVSRLGVVKEENEERLRPLIKALFGFWAIVLACVTAVGIFLAPYIVTFLSPGFHDNPEQLKLGIKLTRILFPYIFLVGLSAMTMGVLHHLRKFTWASSASIFFNGTAILSMLVLSFFWPSSPEQKVYLVAITMLLGGLVQMCSQWPGLKGSGFSLVPSFNWQDPEIKKVLMLIAPSIISVAAIQINVAVNHALSTLIGDGAATSLYYAFRLMQLPVGIVGVAVSTVLLPTLTQHFAKGEEKGFAFELSNALVAVSFLTFPAIGGLLALGEDVVEVIYGHGRFDQAAVSYSWLALQGYLFAIAPYVWNKNLIQGFFARSDTKYPLIVSFFSIIINAGVNITLVQVLDCGVRGLAMGTAFVLMMNSIFLVIGLRYKHGVSFPLRPIFIHLGTMLCWTALMVMSLFFVSQLLQDANIYLRVGCVVPVGMAVYFSLWAAFKRWGKKDFRKLSC
ncbi:MAG: murein biosynthesis integral membrane protein MurJ [Planctomycetes bacterium]|nr:murein biosynthesis integral membrane protein MurJ [Planctomycetota bacterium]